MPDPELEQLLAKIRKLDPASDQFKKEFQLFEAYRERRLQEMIREEAPASPPPPQTPSAAFEGAVAAIRKSTMQPVVRLKPSRKKTSVYDSKLGGIPYLPPEFVYPLSEVAFSKGLPLRMVAQLNFAQLPKLPDFPEKGILQFYIDAFDLYGVNFENLTGQTGFRVVYHEEIEGDESRLQPLPGLSCDAESMPFEGEFLLEAEKSTMPMSWNDPGFEELFFAELRRRVATEATSVWNLETAESNRIFEVFSGEGHRMGGYASLSAEDDPRKADSPYGGHTTLLLQIDSEFQTNLDDTINWGDAGTAVFIIEPERLRQRDFSNVLYLTTSH